MQRGPLDSKLTAKDAVSSDDELDLEEVRRMKNRERAYLAQAHKEDNLPQSRRHAAQEYAALHEARTGQKVDPHSVYDYGPDEPETDLSPEAEADRRRRTHERALRAAAHNPRNSSAERRKAAAEYAAAHEQRTGVKVDVEEEFQVGERLAATRHPVAD